MVDTPEPPAGAGTADAPPGPRPRRGLDRRTLAICFVLALGASIAAALVATIVLDDDDAAAPASGVLELTEPADVSVDRLLSVRLTTVDGEATNLDELRGDGVTVVNFWQSSCVPCIEEMPLLEEARADREDLTFVGVASQDRLEQAIELADQTGITYPWVQDPEGNLFFEARAAGMPTTILLDASGAIVATETGAFADRAELDAFLAEAG
jgi:thiol-disulfide isomerase/thioredoxin